MGCGKRTLGEVGQTARRGRSAFAATRVRFAAGAGERARGLLGKKAFDGVLVMAPCRDVHTVGMDRPIDVAFVDRDGVVVESHRAVPPFKRKRCRRAAFAIERYARPLPWLQPGERVGLVGWSERVRPASPAARPAVAALGGSVANAARRFDAPRPVGKGASGR